MSFKRKIAYNTAVQILGKSILTVLSILLVVLLSRYLGPSGYGQYNIAIVFTGFFATLSDFGIYQTTVRELVQRPKENREIFSNALMLKIFVSAFVFLFAFGVGFLMPYPPVVKWGIGIISLSTFFGAISLGLTSIFQIKYRMDFPTGTELISRALYLVFVIVGIRLKAGLLQIFWFLALANILGLFALFYFSLKFIQIEWRIKISLMKELLRISLPLGLAAIFMMATYKAGPLILSWKKSAYDVGIYSLACQIFDNFMLVPTVFIGLLFPRFSEMVFDRESIKVFFQKSVEILLITLPPLLVFFFFFAPQTVWILGGQPFLSSILSLRILIISFPLFCFSTAFFYLFIAAKRQKTLSLIWGIMAGFNILLNLLLIPKFTYNGVALTLLFVGILGLFLNSLFAFYLIGTQPTSFFKKRSVLPLCLLIVLASFLTALPCWKWINFQQAKFFLQIVCLLFAFVIICFAYLGFLIIFRIVSLKAIKEMLFEKG